MPRLEWCWEKTSKSLDVVFPLYVLWRGCLSECRRLACLLTSMYVACQKKKKKHRIHAVTLNCVISWCVMVLDPHSHWCCSHVPSWAWLLLPGIWGGALGVADGSAVEADVNTGRWQWWRPWFPLLSTCLMVGEMNVGKRTSVSWSVSQALVLQSCVVLLFLVSLWRCD